MDPRASPLTGINVIGEVSGNLGVGVAARHIVKALVNRGTEVAIFDIDAGQGRKGFANEFAHLTVKQASALPHQINLFVLPPAALVNEVVRRGDLIDLLQRENATNAAFTMWELPVLPRSSVRALEVFDIVVATSAFVEAALDFSLSGPQIVHGYQPIEIPPEVAPNRRRFGIPEDAFVVVSSFDPLSDPSRKNPLGAVEAFFRAFPENDSVRLVIKLNGPKSGMNCGDFGSAHFKQLSKRIGADHRVILVAESLSYTDVLSLFASADVFVSLHRAEGLGLGLLESMALGKAVVATGWSGNKSFMRASDACLVKYGLVPVRATIREYTQVEKSLKPLWAEPDLGDAAIWMQRLAASPGLRSTIGNRARDSFNRYRLEAAELRFVDDIMAVREHHLVASPVATRRAALDRRLKLALSTARRDSSSTTGWLAGLAKTEYERRIGWRFAGSRGSWNGDKA